MLSNNPVLDIKDSTQTVLEGTSAFSDMDLPGVAKLRGPFLTLAQQYDDRTTVAEAVDDLIARSRIPAIVEVPRDGSSRLKVINRMEMRNVSAGGRPFYDQFPTARGFVNISRPGFSKNHGVAAIAVQWNDNLLNGPVHLFVLDRRGETWRLRQGADTRR